MSPTLTHPKKSLVLSCFLYILLWGATTCLAQSTPDVLVKARITEAGTGQPVPYAHILKKSDSTGVVADENGFFEVSITIPDSLIISAIGFFEYVIPWNEKTTHHGADTVVIQMQTRVTTLQPIEVFAFKDEYALKKALVETQVEEEKPMEITGLAEAQEAISQKEVTWGKGWYNPHDAGMDDITFGPTFAKRGIITNWLKKKSRKGKADQKYQDLVKRDKLLRSKYNPEWITEMTGLQPEKIDAFIDFCALEEDFILVSTEYELAVAVLACLDEFQKAEN